MPYRLVRQRLELRATVSIVEVFQGNNRVASHPRQFGRRRYVTDPAHMPASHRAHLEWSPSKLVGWAGTISADTASVVNRILESKPHPEQGYRACLGVMSLARRYGDERLGLACTRGGAQLHLGEIHPGRGPGPGAVARRTEPDTTPTRAPQPCVVLTTGVRRPCSHVDPPLRLHGRLHRQAGLAVGSRLCDRRSLNYSADESNLGHARDEDYLDKMARVYAQCHEVLRPGGLLVTATKNLQRRGQCFDLAAATVRLASSVGFEYQQHVVALLAGVRDCGLVARPSFWQLNQTRKARSRGLPAHLVVHEDVLVFAKLGGSE